MLATPRQKDLVASIREMIGERFAGVFTGAVMHTPVEVTERAMQTVRDVRADCIVSLGGGSTTGLGKAIALRTDLPQIVLPTSYAGSEMTPVVGQTSGGIKTTQSSPKILPEIVIYDVDLTMTMPPGLSATSGINAIAHAVEALYARDRNPVISLMAQEGIRTLAHALPNNLRPARRQEPRAPTRSMAPGSLASASAPSAWRCITSSAIRWAGRSICRTRRPTPSFSRTPSPTTRPPRLKR